MVLALIATLVKDARRLSSRRMRQHLALIPADELARAGIRRTLGGSAGLFGR
jgi:hypothetical protein